MVKVVISEEPLENASQYALEQGVGARYWGLMRRTSGWTPPTDVYETGDQVHIRVEIAGMESQQLSVEVGPYQVVISGNRTLLRKNCAYQRMEIGSGRFRVGIQLLEPVHPDQADAVYQDGFLHIKLPKQDSIKIDSKD